jgi:hypothetical protein
MAARQLDTRIFELERLRSERHIVEGTPVSEDLIWDNPSERTSRWPGLDIEMRRAKGTLSTIYSIFGAESRLFQLS